eukprot:1975294-Pyramimonas_sp.AAC.1
MTQALDPDQDGLSACIHIDDLNLCAWGEGVSWVVDSLAGLALKMTKGLHALSLSLSIPKLNMVASSDKVLEAAKTVLKELGGSHVPAAINLGIDFTAGQHARVPGARAQRRKRWIKLRAR